MGNVFGHTFAFIGLERHSGIMVCDVTDPHAVAFDGYFNTRNFGSDSNDDPNSSNDLPNDRINCAAGDLGPEGILFIPPLLSPNFRPLLVVNYETSGSTRIWQIDRAGQKLLAARVAAPPSLPAAVDSPSPPAQFVPRQCAGWEAALLKGIDPLLGADLLYALRSMGHGDEIVLCDTNFPAESTARATVLGKLLRIDAVSSARAARAVLSVLPLDSFVDAPACRMEVVGQPTEIPEVQREVQAEVDEAEDRPWPLAGIERFAFYERAKQAYAVIATGERRFYGCFIFKMGVIPPE